MSCNVPVPFPDLSDLLVRRIMDGIKIIGGKPATQIVEDYVYLAQDEHVWYNTQTQEVRISKEEDLP